jgi:hypothetical protein
MQFLVKDKSGRSSKPYIFDAIHIIECWDLSETDEDDNTIKDYLLEAEIGDTWKTNSVSIERIK